MADHDYDLFVIGAGSGGVRAARISAGLGARVAIAEDRYMGGTCVNVGCIPKKLLVYGAHYAEDFEEAAGFGWSVPKPKFDWKRLIANKDQEITRLNGIYRGLLENAGVRVIDGRGSLLDAHTVAVGEQRFTAEYILVATGGWPAAFATSPGIAGARATSTSTGAGWRTRTPPSCSTWRWPTSARSPSASWRRGCRPRPRPRRSTTEPSRTSVT